MLTLILSPGNTVKAPEPLQKGLVPYWTQCEDMNTKNMEAQNT